MMQQISNPVFQTWIFSLIFFFALALSLRGRKANSELFPLETTQQLKGIAILAVVFSHIGYFLFTDHRFMFPLSVMAGVGVNLFLLLSGYGLTAGRLKRDLPIFQFYKRRLSKIFIPFWLALFGFLLLDFFVLKISYSWQFIASSAFGIFPHADLYNDINSPFWYITLILFYYLLFPLIFSRKRPWLSAVLIYLISYGIVSWNPPLFGKVMFLYRTHIIAFPIGMIIAWLFTQKQEWILGMMQKIKARLNYPFWQVARYLVMIILIGIISYTAYFSGVGETAFKEQMISLTTVLSFLLLFIMLKVEVKLLSLFGIFSYEIYLLHWPLMYRYDIFYRFLPAWLSTVLYMVLFIGVAWVFARLAQTIYSTKK